MVALAYAAPTTHVICFAKKKPVIFGITSRSSVHRPTVVGSPSYDRNRVGTQPWDRSFGTNNLDPSAPSPYSPPRVTPRSPSGRSLLLFLSLFASSHSSLPVRLLPRSPLPPFAARQITRHLHHSLLSLLIMCCQHTMPPASSPLRSQARVPSTTAAPVCPSL